MKNNIITVFLLIGLLIVASCSSDKNAIAGADNHLFSANNLNTSVPIDNTNSAQNQEETFKLLKVESKQPFVWTGTLSGENLKIPKANGNIWNNNKLDDDEKYNKISTAIEVDIMNCGGFLISGKLNKVGDYGWELETMPETAAKDAVDKIKQCDPDSENGFPTSDAFAIAPRDGNRQNIKIGKVDTRKLFASLPREEKQWLDKKLDLPKEYQRVEKANLSLREDNWTDIDGDGEIDLLMLSTVCRADDSEGDKCSGIFLRVNGKWIELGSNSKA